MRLRLVYLACVLLWLSMTLLIGLSLLSRSVFRAEEQFHAFEQRSAEQIVRALADNEAVLDSFAAFQSAARPAASQIFVRQLISTHRQIVRLYAFSGAQNLARRLSLSADGRRRLAAWLSTASAETGSDMQMVPSAAGASDYYLLSSVPGRPRHFVVAQISAPALLPTPLHLPTGWSLQLRQDGPGDALLAEHRAPWHKAIDSVLFPALSSSLHFGDRVQPVTLKLFWQLGFADIGYDDGTATLSSSLVLLLLLILAMKRYARFRAGSQEREKQLFYLANHDRLTNLANRNLFYDRLQHAISRLSRHGSTLAVLYLDMDRFKPVNDTYGHATGDHVLQEIAARLKVELRNEDTVARLGGDEFAVLLEEVESHHEVQQVVVRLKRAIEERYLVDGHAIRLGVSIGVAYYPEDGVLIDELLSAADRNMYGEKHEPVWAA